MPNERPIGIDLGTTFSAAAWVDEHGRTAMIPNAEGDLQTPSIVWFGDAEVIVGKEARSAVTVQPQAVAEWVKRDMGLPYCTRLIRGQRIPPEVVQACILRKLKRDIEAVFGATNRAVISVPAFFDEPQRMATANAGKMAGFDVLDIVNESTAAALSFGESQGYLATEASPREPMTLLVYDLGGGSFDVTLFRLTPDNIKTLATDGEVLLGGYDWDMRLAENVAKTFEQAYGIDPRKDSAAMKRILASAGEAKHALSARNRAMIRVQLGGYSLDVPVTRAQFQEMTADLLERTAYTTQQLLATAQLGWKDVSRILLVGGSTRMPMVVEMLRNLSGIEPDHTVNPDEAVARGTALYASYLQAKEKDAGVHAKLTITNVNSHSLGVEGIEPDTFRKINVTLIPRNTSLPAKVTKKFATKNDNQRAMVIKILEGESLLPGECKQIARSVIQELPEELPKNWPVDVTFGYSEEGLLSVEARVPGTDHKTQLRLERTASMKTDSLGLWKSPVNAAAGFNAFETMVQDVLDPPAASVPDAGVSRIATNTSVLQGWNILDSEDSSKSPLKLYEEDIAAFSASPRVGKLEQPFVSVTPTTPMESPPKPNATNYQFPIPRWLFSMVGHILAALIGLALGALILSWLRPNALQLPW